jgi:hypothetical protein
MKTNNKFSIYIGLILFSCFSVAQVQVNNGTSSGINNSNVILDGSTSFSTEAGAGDYVGKGIIIPSVDLVNFEFDLSLADGSTFPTFFDGMIVYNNATGTTLTTGDRSDTATPVVPGYYYFSNPDGYNNQEVTSGKWLRLGGSSSTIKTKTVPVTVAANPTTASLDLGTTVIAANEVVEYLGAKIYDNATGKLVMTADSEYVKATNVLTTGNGFMYQVLPAGTYNVVVDYR